MRTNEDIKDGSICFFFCSKSVELTLHTNNTQKLHNISFIFNLQSFYHIATVTHLSIAVRTEDVLRAKWPNQWVHTVGWGTALQYQASTGTETNSVCFPSLLLHILLRQKRRRRYIYIYIYTKCFLKGSYFKFSFLFGVLQAVHALIRSLKLQRLKSQNQRDILYKSKNSSMPP